MIHWEEERKCASYTRFTLQFNRSAQKFRKSTTDRKSEAGSSILTAGRSFCLLECFKNDILFFMWNSNTSVLNLKCNNILSHIQVRIETRPPVFISQINVQADISFFCKLKCIGKKVLQNLIQPLDICRE